MEKDGIMSNNLSYENAKICYICKEKSENKYVNDKQYFKVRDNCYYAGK